MGVQQSPQEQNQLTEPYRTKPYEHNNKKPQTENPSTDKPSTSGKSRYGKKVVVSESLKSFVSDKGLKISEKTLITWIGLADEETIKAAISETLDKPGINSVVGYITGILKQGYTPSMETKETKPLKNGVIVDKLPETVQRQLEREQQQSGSKRVKYRLPYQIVGEAVDKTLKGIKKGVVSHIPNYFIKVLDNEMKKQSSERPGQP